MKRFSRNKQTITNAEQAYLAQQKILVLGLGGLGSHVIEGLARIGVMHLGICDDDVAEVSNLNRQLLVLESTIGRTKCALAKERIHAINSAIDVKCYPNKYPHPLLNKDLSGYDLVIDCLDNVATRKQLEKDCLRLDKRLIYGTIAGNFGYFGVISNENPLMQSQLMNGDGSGIEKALGNPYYIVAMVASLQVMIALRVLLDKSYLKKGFYIIDLLDVSIEEVVLS